MAQWRRISSPRALHREHSGTDTEIESEPVTVTVKYQTF